VLSRNLVLKRPFVVRWHFCGHKKDWFVLCLFPQLLAGARIGRTRIPFVSWAPRRRNEFSSVHTGSTAPAAHDFHGAERRLSDSLPPASGCP